MKLFKLTKYKIVQVYRYPQGEWVDGKWVKGNPVSIDVKANIQPANYKDIVSMPEADRTKKWCKIWSESRLRTKTEGTNGNDPDYFYWQGELYEVRKTQEWDMGVLNHFHALAARLEITPKEIAAMVDN